MKRLGDVISVLCHVRAGERVVLPCMISQVREGLDAIGAKAGSGRGNRRRPMPPAWIAGMDWLAEVEKVARGFTSRTPWGERYSGDGGSVERLVWLAEVARPRPQDTGNLRDIEGVLSRLATEGEKLLDPVLFTVDADCPVCGARFFQAPNGIGGYDFHAALMVRSSSAECGACGTVWRGGEVLDLAMRVTGNTKIQSTTPTS